MANHNNGMGMKQAVRSIMSVVNDAARCLPGFSGTHFDTELRHICAEMRKRIMLENEVEK